MSTVARGQKTFDTLQVGRGIAAIMVVLCHVGALVGKEPGLWERHWIADWFVVGSFGVDFFFILSGIVILMAHWNDIDRPARVPVFFWKRFRRLYPIYWVLLIPLILKSIVTHSYKTQSTWIIVSNMTLLHIRSLDTIMGPSWTLFHEILFYLVFSLLIYRKYLGIVALSLWLGATVFYFDHASMAIVPAKYASFVFSPLHLLFGFGMVVGFAIHHKYVTKSIGVFAVGLGVFIASLGFTVGDRHLHILWIRIVGDMGLAVSVWAAMGIELAHTVKFPAFLRLLGDSSYSLYLTHFMVMSVIARTLYAHDHRMHTPLGLVMVLMFVPAIVIGVAIHVWVEAPLIRFVSGLRKGKGMQLPVGVTAA